MTVASRLWRAGLVLVLLLAFSFTVAAPPERCPSVSVDELRRSSEATVDWFVANQGVDGRWLYEYRDADDVTTPEYNEVRHAGVTMGLYQAAAAGIPGALESADEGTEWAVDRLVRRDGAAALATPERVTTGATALLAAGLVIRRESTGEERHDELLRELGRFLQAQTEPSGAVLSHYDRVRGAPVPGEYSKYYTGEAYWALGLLHRTFPDDGFGGTADRIGAYLATSRDDEEGYWPPIPDHWAAYGMAEAERERALSEDEVEYAREQAGLMGAQARWLAQQHGPLGGVVRGGQTARGGWYGVVGEGLTGWWLVARDDARLDDLRASIAERATCVAGLAIEEQSGADDAADAARPERVRGAWYRDGSTRMDDQQHALAALLRTIPIVEAGEDPGSSGPSWWLWLAVLLLALNPARVALAVPRGACSPRDVARVAAVGGLAVGAVAFLGDPLLDLLDVSEPSFRLAAGFIAVLVGAVDVFRRTKGDVARACALVPLAFPIVARPALVVLALGAGADRSGLVVLAAMALGVGALTLLVARSPSERALRWAGRLLAVGLVACGLLLTIDGALDV